MDAEHTGYERLQTVTTVQSLGRVGWDAIGQFLVAEVDIRHRDGHLVRIPVSLPPEVAEALWIQLDAALAEREREDPSRQ